MISRNFLGLKEYCRHNSISWEFNHYHNIPIPWDAEPDVHNQLSTIHLTHKKRVCKKVYKSFTLEITNSQISLWCL